ncbi:MAG: Sensor protein [uncultured bacterium]|nr:MAG: Sensor protein [uncultured bacterium]
MDIQMPELDGIEATKMIRSGKSGALDPATPIVALTAHAMKGDRERYLACGMNGYITKPIDTIQLEASLETLLSPPNPKTKNPPEVPPDAPPESRAARPNPHPPVDFPAFVARLMGDELLAEKIYSSFRADLPVQLEILARAVQQGNVQAIQHQAHKMKGTSGNVCAHALHRTMAEMETAAREADMAQVEELFRQAMQQQEVIGRFEKPT